MKNIFLKGFIFGIGFCFTVLAFIIGYGAWTNISPKSNGQVINADSWNELVNNINTIGGNVDTIGGDVNTIKNSYSTLGVGQTRINVTASRTLGTTYTNTTGKPIMVNISTIGANVVGAFLYVDNMIVATQNALTNDQARLSAIIPNGSTYKLTGVAASVWAELR